MHGATHVMAAVERRAAAPNVVGWAGGLNPPSGKESGAAWLQSAAGGGGGGGLGGRGGGGFGRDGSVGASVTMRFSYFPSRR
jgi:hypothetical protein